VPAHATGALGFQGRAQLPRQLVTGKVKVHPGVGAAQHIHLKTTGHLQVGDVEGKMEEAFHEAELSKSG
jgi:hypothetical protein